MADIKKELNAIKNAVYGKEVRGSIHDGIKKINDEVENATDLSESAKHQVENIQQQVNQLVVEGDSSVEAAQARVDADGNTFTTLKERLDTKETQFASQLAQIAINIKSFGAVGGNQQLDTEAFILAQSKAREIGGYVYFPKTENPYMIDSTANGVIVSMVGNDSHIQLIGDVLFQYDGNFKLQNLTIESDFEYTNDDSSVSSLFSPLNDVDEIVLDNIKYFVNTSLVDGSVRGKTLIKTKAKKVIIKNVSGENSRAPISIHNTDANDTEFIILENIHFKNVQTLIYLDGGPVSTPSERNLNNVLIKNITLINTEEQSKNYSFSAGSDVIMAERVNNININRIISQYPCERAIYLNQCNEVNISDVLLKWADGVKVVGFTNKLTGYSFTSKNININNIRHYGGYDQNTITLYEVSDVFINDIQVINHVSDSVNTVVELSRTVENITIENIKGRNTRRGVINLLSDSGEKTVNRPDGSTLTFTYDNYFKDIKIRNIDFLNPIDTNNGYYAIRFRIDDTLTQPYIFENIEIDNVKIKNNRMINRTDLEEMNFYHPSSIVPGLININKVKGLKVVDSYVHGISSPDGGITIGSSCENVFIDVKLQVLDTVRLPQSIYANPGSKIEIWNSHPSAEQNFKNTIYPIGVFEETVKVDTKHKGMFELTSSVSSQDRVLLPKPTKSGYLEMYSDNGEYMICTFSDGSFTKVSGSSLTSDVLMPGYICVYQDPSNNNYYIRNRLDYTIRIDVKLSYINE